jgi:hypothetical protein
MKTCSKCKQEKPLDEFGKQTRSKSGYRSWCKVCHREDGKTRPRKRDFGTEKYKELKRKYYKNNKETIQKQNKEWGQTLKGKWHSYQRCAKTRNYEWNLDFCEFSRFWQNDCYYCNSPIKTIGIDRLDSSEGYSLDNCVSCCSICNIMKMDLPLSTFIDQIKRIYVNYRDKRESD